MSGISLDEDIGILELSDRTTKILRNAGYNRIRQFVEAPYYIINMVRDISNRRYMEIVKACLSNDIKPLSYDDYLMGRRIERVRHPKGMRDNRTLGSIIGMDETSLNLISEMNERRKDERGKL